MNLLNKIKGYLDHDLKVKHHVTGRIFTVVLGEIGEDEIHISEVLQEPDRYIPILKSTLSDSELIDLGKHILSPFTSSSAMRGNMDYIMIALKYLKGTKQSMSLINQSKVIEYLYSIKYDLHNLIGQGLAINESTTK